MRIMKNAIVLSQLINRAFRHVVNTSSFYNIDESHALKHSMEVFKYAKNIYDSEVIKNPGLARDEQIIYAASIGHDMCDKKYMNVTEGVIKYKQYLYDIMKQPDLDVMGNIITSMSYSCVKANGYPELGEHQLAYHIVREADLLAAYDIDRCIMYSMHRDNCDYTQALSESLELFDYRVLMMRKHRLFITDYSKKESLKLHNKALKDVASLKDILHIQNIIR